MKNGNSFHSKPNGHLFRATQSASETRKSPTELVSPPIAPSDLSLLPLIAARLHHLRQLEHFAMERRADDVTAAQCPAHLVELECVAG